MSFDNILFYQEFTDPNQAVEFEKKIKKWSRAKKTVSNRRKF